jgi:NifU-like protein involved in Fe-S cluster formation
VAAASLLLERAEGASLREVAALAPDAMIALLDTELPEGRRRCATLALETLQRALATPPAVPGAAREGA